MHPLKRRRQQSKTLHPQKLRRLLSRMQQHQLLAERKVQSVARTENEKILATNASSEAPLERQKMIILFMKIRLLSLQSRAICN
jgi:hypothetical protein